MKKMKKILCFLMAFTMVFGCMSGMALAAAPTITKETRPADGVTEDQPFAPGTGGSQNFRIPCLVTLDDGTIVAACDARWNHASDACGLDTIVSRSTDGGKTWNYTFANYLGDNGNVFSYNSTAFIDPAIATNGEKIWMIADIYPAGVAINTVPGNMQARPGHTGFDANHNLALAKATDSIHGLSTSDSRITAAFDYSLVKIEGANDTDASYYNIVDKNGNVVEGYEIDAYFNIKGEGVDTNLFIGDSPYFPWPTDFLYMTSSVDGGATWSVPTLIDVKRQDEQTLLVGPGRGITVELPDGTERIIFTAYDFTYSDDRSCAIYSDDGGKTWTRGADVASWSSESVVTEADEKLYLFTRHGKAYYVSENYGESWGPQKSTSLSYNDNCQLTAITYSEKIDGKTAILFAAPSSTSSRANGKIYVGLVQEDGSLDFAYEYAVNTGNYAYSCMDELADGNIALLYESAGSAITYKTISMREILGFEKNLVLDPEDVYVDEKEATEPAEITQEPNEKVATVASEFVVEEAVVRLRDYALSANASLSAFATENGVYSLEDCEFTFTKNGEKWKINNASSYLDISSANNYLGTATDLTVTKVDPDEAVTGDEVFRICNGENRYAIFYTENMTFDAWATTNISSVKSTVKFDLVLLEKQDKVSPADVMPGYTRATEVKDGGVYLISYIWGADTEDRSDNGLIVLYPANGQTSQTKLVGTVATLAKNKVTITAVAPGETTAVVGDVTYNITVNDPAKSPSYAGNDLPTEGMKLTAGSLEPTEGSLEALFDGDEDTFYHSNWSGVRPTADDFWITVELPEVTKVAGMRYLPRQSSANGRILAYEIYCSLDGEEWTEVTSGKWADDDTWKKASFDGVDAKYVKIFAIDSRADNSGRHLTGAELRVVKATEPVEPPVDPEIPVMEDVVRVSGATRYETGYKVADALKETLGVDKFDAVVVATGKNFADALAGSYLAVQKNAPIILTNGKDDNIAQLHEYIAANVAAGGKVYILGGEGAVPAAAAAIEGYEVVRLAGKSRYETNLAILAEAGVTGDSVIVATGKNFADSLSASAAKLPILLVKPEAALTEEAKAVLGGMKNIYIIGGEGAVSAEIAAELAAFGEVTRVSGATRYETSVAVAKTFFGTVNAAVVASGKNFPDGLCGGPLAAAMNVPLILTADGRTEMAEKYVQDNNIKRADILGGRAAISDQAVKKIFKNGVLDLEDTKDTDHDGISDVVEKALGTNHELSDTDFDRLSDAEEVYQLDTDPTLADSDEDGILDGDEDSDGDGLSNMEEIRLDTNPLMLDSDYDGLSDEEEYNLYGTDPTLADTDEDGILDGDELILGTDPLSKKSDGITNDGEKCFEQELAQASYEPSLFDENSMIPTVAGNVPDIIDNHVTISEYEGTFLDENRAVVGKPVSVESSYSDEAELTVSFTADVNEEDRLDYCAIACIKDGEIELCDTEVDGNTLSTNAADGDYFIIDTESFLEYLNIPIKKYKNAPIAEEISTEEVITYGISNSNEVSEEWYNENYAIVNKDNEVVTYSEIDSVIPTQSIVDVQLAEDESLVLKNTTVQTTTSGTKDTKGKISGQADIVFAVDTTGSMSGAINNVVANIDSFVDALQMDYSVKANFALIDYKDITCGEKTILVKNGSSAWFDDVTEFKREINKLYVQGGGDIDETAIDALGMAHKLDFRQNANKFVILVTDAGYKIDNNYGISSMGEMIKLLKESNVVTSVIAPTYYEDEYHDLYSKTNGVFGNIYGNFKTVLLQLADNIGTIVNDGSWVLLDDYQFVKLGQPLENSSYSTDGDSLSDWEELGSKKEKNVKPFIDWVLSVYNIPEGMYDDPTTVAVYCYESNPVLVDTDYDGINDGVDTDPRNNKFTGQVMSYEKDSDTKAKYSESAGKITFNMDYTKFFGDLSRFDNTLSTMAWIYASDIYENNNYVTDDSDTQVYVDDVLTTSHKTPTLMKMFGLSDTKKVEVGYKDNDRTDIAIGHRYVEYSGQKKEIIVVAVRGTNSTFEEWSSNFDVGADTIAYETLVGKFSEWKTKENHKGFDVTANRVKTAINDYIKNTKRINSSAEKVYLITGHSRGAAIANVVAAYLIDDGKNVVAYTFATPETTTSNQASKSKYGSIFNVINEDDLIPRLPLENKWNFRRYGVDKVGSISAASGKKTWFGAGGEYEGGPFKELVGIKYDNNEKVESMISAFEEVCESRDEIYNFTFEKNTLELQGTNHFDKENADKKVQKYKDSKPPAMQKVGDFQAIEGNNGFGKTVWRVGCYQTPAYFMQGLADLAATQTFHEMADKYTSVRNQFVTVFLSGMEHPHWVQSYYLLSNGTVSFD